MPLSIGDRLGPYEILGPLGKGGMGEVYKARDTKLDRDVAIKVLPAALARDPERLARFDREAKILASLNHPNIAQIHAIQEVNGTRALVMELVPGETLKRPLPLAETLRVARQIADAVQAAHDKNIVHRDLKPANIMITPQGVVKVLDFGLAKLTEVAVSSGDPGESPTLTMAAATQAGTVMGTALYMAPEQARGQQDIDRRADIWAFGVVLYEMLTGKHPFRGGTISDILASVLKVEPDFEPVPAKMRPLLRSCLQKEPRERLQAIGDWELLLQDPPAPAASKQPWMIAAAVLAVVAAGASWIAWRASQSAALPSGATVADLAFSIAPPAGGLMPVGELHATPEISPDGSAVLSYGVAEGAVFLRPLNNLTPEPVRLGGGVFGNPGFWSSDSRTLLYSDGTNLKKMRVPDGSPETVVNDAAVLLGGGLSDKGTLLFAAVKSESGLYQAPAGGDVAKEIELTGIPEGRPAFPEFLPGSEDFLFLLTLTTRGIEESEVYLATLRDGRAVDLVLLMKNSTAARYTPAGGGRILYVRNDNLYARTLNRTTRKLEGEPELIQQSVASSPAFGRAHFSVSRNGVVAWRPGTAGLSTVTIFDRQGKEIGTAGPPSVVQTLKLAPDEKHLLLGFSGSAWLLEPNRPGQQRVAQGNRETLFLSDGSKVVDAIPFGGKVQTVVERPVTGDGAARELAKPPGLGRLEDISPDGKTILFSRGALDTAVFAFPLDGSTKEPRNLVPTSNEMISHARFSPDGRWIMYGAREGRIYAGGGIYVQPFPTGLRKQLTNRGNYPVWRKDGKEIVYLDDYKGRTYIWSVPVTVAGGEISAGTPVPLFPARLPATTFGDLNFLAVSRDGSRFYIPQAVEQPDSGIIHVRMGFFKP